MKNRNALIELNLAVLCISTSGVFGRSMSLSPELIILYRCILAGFLLYIFIKNKGLQLGFRTGADKKIIIWSGLLMAGHWVTYFYALKLSNIAIAMLTLHAFPAMTAIMEPLILKTKFKAYHLLLAVLVISGIYILLPSSDLGNSKVIAIILGLASALFYALRNIFSKKVIAHYNGSVMMFYQLVSMTLVLSPFAFLYDSSPIQDDWIYLILLAVVTTAIGHTLLVKNLKSFSAITVSLISSIIPVYGIIFGIIFLSEIPSMRTAVGGALIMLSFMVEIYQNSKTDS